MISITAIAQATGVSRTAVSFILNGKAKELRLADETVKRVLDYCRKVHYVPNFHARKMREKRPKNLLVLLNSLRETGEPNPFSDYNAAMIVGGIANAAERAGYSFNVQIFNAATDERAIFDSFRSREIGAMITYGIDFPADWLKVFAAEKRAVVAIAARMREAVSAVTVDNFGLSRDLTAELIRRGRRKFLYFAGVDFRAGSERLAGFLAALAGAGLDPDEVPVIGAQFNEMLAYRRMGEYLAGGKAYPDAVVAANDYMAFGVLRALGEAGLAVPGRVAVAGGDNVAAARYVTPGLATFDNCPQQAGEEAFELACRMAETGEAEEVVIPSKLILRDSI